jgi:hypothetical protein
MSRDGSGIYSIPPGTEGIPDTTIESTKYNGFVHDVETDLNAPRPIIAGGTGATSAAEACTNIGAVKVIGDTMTGDLSITSTTPSSSSATGALTVAGGVGVGENITIGNAMTAAHGFIVGSGERTLTIQSTSAGNANLRLRGIGGGIGHVTSDNHLNLNAGGGNSVNVTGTAASTSSTTGALVVAGGGGVGGALNVNGRTIVTDNGSAFPAAGLHFSTNSGDGGVAIANTGAGGTTWFLASTNNGSGFGGGAFRIYDIVNSADRFSIKNTGQVTVHNSLASTSSTTGALVVSGGVGVGGTLRAQGGAVLGAAAFGGYGVVSMGAIDTSDVFYVDTNTSGTAEAVYIMPIRTGSSHTFRGGIQYNSGSGLVAYNTSSDERGKPYSVAIDHTIARDVVDAIKIFDFGDDRNVIRGIGWTAQQAYAVHTSLATPGRTPDEWWTVERSAPMPFVIANVQQLNQRLDALERQLKEKH